MKRAALALALVPAFTAACGSESPPPAPEARLELVPRSADLERAAEAFPPPPDEERRAVLAEILDAAFSSAASATARELALAELEAAPDRRFALEAGLVHAEDVVRSHCAHRLGELGEPAAIPALLWRLREEGNAEVSGWVASGLDALGNRSGLEPLAALIELPRSQDQALPAADAVLGRAGRVPEERTWANLAAALRELHREWDAERTMVFEEAALDPVLRGRLARLLADLDGFQLKPVDEARSVYRHLGRLPGDLLRLGLTAEETYLRVHTLEIVRSLGPVAAPLGEDVQDLLRDPTTRPYAIETLGELRYVPAYEEVASHLESPSPELRTAAAGALGLLGDPRAEAPLRALFDDVEQPTDVRVRAAFGLALLGDDGGREFLAARLEAGDYHPPTLRELLDRAAARTPH